MPKQQTHIPVLLSEVRKHLSPQRGDEYLDLTAGYGGHAIAVIDKTQAHAVLVDRDANAQSVLRKLFSDRQDVLLVQLDFEQASRELIEQNQRFDVILADIGISSPHIDNKERGFSLQLDGPLDMRMDQSQSLSAATIVNTYSQGEIAKILRDYGEEPKAKRIAQLIVDSRPLESTTQLAEIVKKVWPGYSKVHPATRTFQALRIAVNDELGQLERSLPLWVELLKPGGRLGVITFHSLEDRIVKQFFRSRAGDRYDTDLDLLTTRPVIASQDEIVTNPRSRSAKLRVVKRK